MKDFINHATEFVIIVEANQPMMAGDVYDGIVRCLRGRRTRKYYRNGTGGIAIPGALKTEQTTHAMYRWVWCGVGCGCGVSVVHTPGCCATR